MNFNFLYGFTPCIPSLKPLRPPLLYDIMNGMINFNNQNPYSIHELSKQASSKVFNFNYPLSSKVNKQEFEESILNNFINRRLGYETFTLFQIKLKTKMNEIMPTYNKMFDVLDDWNIFADGEKETKDSTNIRNTISNTTNELTTESSTSTTEDNRFSELPENQIQDVQNGSYMSDYRYVQNSGNDNSSSNGKSDNTTDDTNNYNETRSKDVSNKIDVYTKFIESKNNIMSMIYKDLEVLFYQIID